MNLNIAPQEQILDELRMIDAFLNITCREQLEVEEAKRRANYYKLMYEAEHRKLKPILKRLVEVERELNELKKSK